MMIFTKMVGFAKKNVVLMVAVLAAVITSFIIPPDEQYISYFDFKTLSCLFCVLAVVCALKNINFFYILAQKIVKSCRNIRASILTLVYITFIGSMLIANDISCLKAQANKDIWHLHSLCRILPQISEECLLPLAIHKTYIYIQSII